MTPFDLIQKLPQPLRIAQLMLALIIFVYYGLKPFTGEGGSLLIPAAMHLVGNILLMLSVAVAFYPARPLPQLFIYTLIFSIGIEAAQGLTATRTADMFDVITNTLGVLIGLGLIRVFGPSKDG